MTIISTISGFSMHRQMLDPLPLATERSAIPTLNQMDDQKIVR